MPEWMDPIEAAKLRDRLKQAIKEAYRSDADEKRIGVEVPYVDVRLTWREDDDA